MIAEAIDIDEDELRKVNNLINENRLRLERGSLPNSNLIKAIKAFATHAEHDGIEPNYSSENKQAIKVVIDGVKRNGGSDLSPESIDKASVAYWQKVSYLSYCCACLKSHLKWLKDYYKHRLNVLIANFEFPKSCSNIETKKSYILSLAKKEGVTLFNEIKRQEILCENTIELYTSEIERADRMQTILHHIRLSKTQFVK